MLLKTNADKAFGVKTYMSNEMEQAIQLWKQLEGSNGLKPPWVDEDTKTIRFSNTIARELASLITQNIDIKVQAAYGESEKSEYIQKNIDTDFLTNVQEIVEKMIRLGGVMAKWNGTGVEYLTPDMFLVTDYDSEGNINGCIFFSYYSENEKFFTRAEWHRFETISKKKDDSGEESYGNVYKISNKSYVSEDTNEIGREIPLKKTKWKDIESEVRVENLKNSLFKYFKNPFSNTIDPDSPLGVSAFSESIEELRWLDIAISTMGVETEDSKPIVFVSQSAIQFANINNIKLPRYVQGLEMGNTVDNTIEQWNPTMQVASRIEGINFLLSIISYKAGFDPGYFVFDGQKVTMATATQVESSEQRTINTVMSYRNLFERPKSNGDGRVGFIHDLAYIIDATATMDGKFPPEDFGNYEIFCSFADLTSNAEEDKAFSYQLAQNGYISKARFLVLHMGYTEEEAIQLVEEARAEREESNSVGLFGDE